MVLFFNPYIFASTIVQNLPYVTDNLVAYWEQSGYSTGTINVSDLSGQNHPVQYSVSTPSTVTSTSVSSNANTSLTNDTYTLNFSQGLTYEVLFTLASVANGQDPTIMFWDPYSGGGGQMMNISATKLVPYMYNANINQGYVYPGNAQLNTGQWYHVMFTSTPQGLWNFYLDGYPTASGSGFVMPVGPQTNYNFGVGNPVPFVNQYQTTTSCVAFWDFGDTLSYPGTGSTVNSLSYTSTTGTITGTSSFGNSALTLKTTSSAIANSSVTLNMASTGTTFETIFNPSTLTGNIMSFSTSSGAVSFGLTLNATSNVQMIVSSASANTLPITITSGIWYHLAISVTSGGAFSYYVDGLLVTSGQLATALPSSLIQTLGLGAPPTQATGFTGSFAMARVYNYALTPAQVIRNYQAVLNKFTNNPYNLPANTSNTFTTSSNLLGYWDFTKTCSYTGGQTFVNDLSGSGRPLIIVSTVLPTYTSNGYTSITAGTGFGANVSATVAYSNLMTAECMFCTGSVSATVQPIIYNTAAATNGFNLRVNQTSSGGFTITGPNATTYYASSNVNVQSNTWYHMLAIVDKTRTLYIYINGTQVSSFPNISFIDPGTTPMGFGTTDAGTGYKLGLGRVYNVPLTPNQIWNNYVSSYNSGVYSNTGTTYITNGLLGYWDFVNYTPGSSILQDLSPNGKNLTLSGVTYKNVNGAISGYFGAPGGSGGSALNSSFTATPNSGCSFEFLFYTSSNTVQQEVLDFYGTNNYLFGLNSGGGTNAQTITLTNGSTSYITTPTGSIINNTWYHVIFSITNSSTYQVYINGSVVTTSGTPSIQGSVTQTLSIGGRSGSFVTSNVSMVRVYSIPLTAVQVQTNYYSAFNKLYGNPYALSPTPSPTSIIYSNPNYPPALVITTGNSNQSTTYINSYSYGNGTYVATSSSIYVSFEYPPSAMTASSTTLTSSSIFNTLATTTGTITYGIGTYNITDSGFLSTYSGYHAFDKSVAAVSNTWIGNATYNSPSGTYTTGASLGGINGEWVKIQLPNTINILSYQLTSRSDSSYTTPGTFTILASNDGSTWVSVDSRSGQTWSGAGVTNIYTIVSPPSTAYSWYAIVIQVITNVVDTRPCIGELRIFGN